MGAGPAGRSTICMTVIVLRVAQDTSPTSVRYGPVQRRQQLCGLQLLIDGTGLGTPLAWLPLIMQDIVAPPVRSFPKGPLAGSLTQVVTHETVLDSGPIKPP